MIMYNYIYILCVYVPINIIYYNIYIYIHMYIHIYTHLDYVYVYVFTICMDHYQRWLVVLKSHKQVQRITTRRKQFRCHLRANVIHIHRYLSKIAHHTHSVSRIVLLQVFPFSAGASSVGLMHQRCTNKDSADSVSIVSMRVCPLINEVRPIITANHW